MGVQVPSDLSNILTAVQNKLITDNLFNSATSWLSVNPELLINPPGNLCCILSPGEQSADQPIIAGAGSACFWINGEIRIGLWVRDALDQYGRADSLLGNATLGLLQLRKAVLKSLQLFVPTDSNGNYLCAEPFRYLNTYFSNKVEGSGWSFCVIKYEVHYTQDIS